MITDEIKALFIIIFFIMILTTIFIIYMVVKEKMEKEKNKAMKIKYPEIFKLRKIYYEKLDKNFNMFYEKADKIEKILNNYNKEEPLLPNEIIISKADEIENLKETRWNLLQEYNKRRELLKIAGSELFEKDFPEIDTAKVENILMEVIFDESASDFNI